MAGDLHEHLEQAAFGIEVGDVADAVPHHHEHLEEVARGQLGGDGVAGDGDELRRRQPGEQFEGGEHLACRLAVAAVEIRVGPAEGPTKRGPQLVGTHRAVDLEEPAGLHLGHGVHAHGTDGTVGAMSDRRWIVIGAGAIGGTVGGRLHQGGAEVVLVARGAHGEALRDRGLLLRDPDGDERLDIPTVAHPSEVSWRDGDVALLATKTQQATAALDDLVAAAPDAPVVCLTNGVDAERQALRRLAQVHGMCVMLPATHLEPGVVEVSSAPCSGVLDIGVATGGSDDVDDDLAAALRAGAFVADPTPTVLRRKRAKLLLNLVNVLDAACGPDPGVAPIAERAQEEGREAMAAAGLDWSTPEEDLARRGDHIRMRRIDGRRRGGGSTWQSLARGAGDSEADYLNGEVVLLGRLHGVPTPVNEVLQRLAREAASTGMPPGTLSADEIRARL